MAFARALLFVLMLPAWLLPGGVALDFCDCASKARTKARASCCCASMHAESTCAASRDATRRDGNDAAAPARESCRCCLHLAAPNTPIATAATNANRGAASFQLVLPSFDAPVVLTRRLGTRTTFVAPSPPSDVLVRVRPLLL